MADATLYSSPHRHGGNSVRRVMALVAAALVPGVLAYTWQFGAGVLFQCLLAAAAALATEWVALLLRHRPPGPALADGSALVTGLLIGLTLSPLTPWWATVLAAAFAVGLVKHAFGGLGQNLFNPAMAGFVFVLLCFPAQLNRWPAAPEPGAHGIDPGAAAAAIFGDPEDEPDGLSGASALNHLKSRLGQMEMVSEIRTAPAFGTLGGRGWEWVAAGWVLGGLALLFLGVIRWHIPAGFLAGMVLVSGVGWMLDPEQYAAPLFHVMTPGAMLGAFFIATDPVTAATSDRGRLVYGALIGIVACTLRLWGAYPDGVAFAVLLGNACAPLIDRLTVPRVLGEQR